ncbi:MAG: ABC transporter substrate-binding protein [Microvirga sp.]
MHTRRQILISGGALALQIRPARSLERVVKVGVLPFGTAGWETDTIRRNGFDLANGFRVEEIKLASSEAARIAFLSGAVDTIVTDLLWAARLRAEGRNARFLPFSSTEGGVIVAPRSPIQEVRDLAGRSIGVAGGPLDKSWLLLRALAVETAGFDPSQKSSPAFGAPPLLSHKLEAGELDAALLFWQFCARLKAKGFREILRAGEMARFFGASGEIALLGYLFDEDRSSDRTILAGFATASRQAKTLLASSDAAWEPVRPRMQAEDEATFQVLKRYFIDGVPKRDISAERADAERLYAVLARLGGEKLLGSATSLPAGLYADIGQDG